MYILGISCWYHDSAAALIKDGKIVACGEEERFSRIKHDHSFPLNAVNFCLEKAEISASELDYVVFYDKPILKFDRIISSIICCVPKSAGVFREAVPLWLKEKLKFRKKIKKTLGVSADKVLFCTHHESHAASAFFLSPFDEAALLTVDGVGEWATASLGYGRGNKITITDEMRFPHSLGLLYSAFTAFLGFKVNNGEYKVMGMAPYGEPRFVDKVYELVRVFDDGGIELNMEYFAFPYSVKKTFTDKFVELFGSPRLPGSMFYTPGTEFPVYYEQKPHDYERLAMQNQYYADIAASIQFVLEDILIKMAKHLKAKTGMANLCYAGGVALNSKANYRIIKEGGFEDVFIQPAATDAGGALGAAFWCWNHVLGNKKTETMNHSYWGKDNSDEEIKTAINKAGLTYLKSGEEELIDKVAQSIAAGKVVGWFQSRAEWGPRALGNRSILADPRDPDMKNKVNTIIKFREPFRPFAPSILEEDADDYIERGKEAFMDRFMLVTYPVKEDKKKIIPAVTHVNGTARIQSVSKEHNPRYWKLINAFKNKTGVGVLLNTSFNLKGEPVVNTPEDAIKTFLKSGIDMLVLENFLITKE